MGEAVDVDQQVGVARAARRPRPRPPGPPRSRDDRRRAAPRHASRPPRTRSPRSRAPAASARRGRRGWRGRRPGCLGGAARPGPARRAAARRGRPSSPTTSTPRRRRGPPPAASRPGAGTARRPGIARAPAAIPASGRRQRRLGKGVGPGLPAEVEDDVRVGGMAGTAGADGHWRSLLVLGRFVPARHCVGPAYHRAPGDGAQRGASCHHPSARVEGSRNAQVRSGAVRGWLRCDLPRSALRHRCSGAMPRGHHILRLKPGSGPALSTKRHTRREAGPQSHGTP